MARFMFVYRSPLEAEKEITPEVMQEVMEVWNHWIGKGFQEGWLIDVGDALHLEGKVVNDQKVVSDGPFAESKEIVGGYSVVEAESLEHAAELAKSNPMLATPGGTVEVRPLAGMGGKQ